MSSYLEWCEGVRFLPLSTPGVDFQSINRIKMVSLPDKSTVIMKTVSNDVVYIPRLKVLGEAAYSLFDYHLYPAERVTPNVCPISPNILWRQFINGKTGDEKRASLHSAHANLATADLEIVSNVLDNPFAQRIALLDFIFLCQDRSAQNWVVDTRQFWAIDNGMFWAYKGRYADKKTVETGSVAHLNHPMEALAPRIPEFIFRGGLFSFLHAGRIIHDGLLAWLYQIDWFEYLHQLGNLIGVLGYPTSIMDDWRFVMLKKRMEWLLDSRRFPTKDEAFGEEWQRLIDKPENANETWRLEWETENSETK